MYTPPNLLMFALTHLLSHAYFHMYILEPTWFSFALYSSTFTDLASLGALSKYTCGQTYYHPSFNAARDAPKLTAELSHNLTRTTGWEAVMRVRMSKGLRISSYHGHFFIRSTDLLALPQVGVSWCLILSGMSVVMSAIKMCSSVSSNVVRGKRENTRVPMVLLKTAAPNVSCGRKRLVWSIGWAP